ncbi:MFS transporter [Pokkaliibacter sp. CJK22405]|uniref:MFS transporter n=1 Tax=Pokkaliibacter sp. CJK22405 TaxID=3384615 RepID=UPI003984CF66
MTDTLEKPAATHSRVAADDTRPSIRNQAISTPTDTPIPSEEEGAHWIRKGTPAYRAVEIALFLAGFACFSLIYCVQPLLPSFAQSFGLSPGAASLALSLTTGFLACSIMVTAAISQSMGRRGMMLASMTVAAVLTIIAALVPSWHALLISRAALGVMLGGVPAVAMAYLAEEIEPAQLGKVMGLFIAGNAFGAMMGRVGMGVITEFASWQTALGTLGVMCFVAAVGFAFLLPRSQNFVAQRKQPLSYHFRTWGEHLRNPQMQRLYGLGFVFTSIFVTMFNYASFRLAEAPFELSQTARSLIFLVYGMGMVSSTVAGNLTTRFGQRKSLVISFTATLAGVLLTLDNQLPVIILGIALVTIGFFIGHAVASGAIGPLAGSTKGHASSLYLMFYYFGSSITGTIGGYFWEHGGWLAVCALTALIALAGLWLSLLGRKAAA